MGPRGPYCLTEGLAAGVEAGLAAFGPFAAGGFMTCGGSILSNSTSNISSEPGGMAPGEFMS